ncbi:hypothetical protein CIB95_04155 [Lottiidibacillus patelloidae]|uniref:TolB domain-containing protein n=1 Tax=Lottiidibacillus patelloidae TaxID=2670334 RepID=A0A263BUZ5_9BACI|nr:hypothetical protein [Lottiidibacillus patelloidae]OZM57571.1 hypothetical protein CIB95_04155 [Lottiidibacillus patelloidae]
MLYSKVLIFLVFILFMAPSLTDANAKHIAKAVFIRDGNLFLLINNEEKQITKGGTVVGSPQWSHDGKWIVYSERVPVKFQQIDKQDVTINVYHLETEKVKQIFHNGYSPKWSPTKNVVSFNFGPTLNISNLTRFYNIATGVSSYAWFPDGSGFILSTSGNLTPKGWTGATLYKKEISENYEEVLLGEAELFLKLPSAVGFGDIKGLAVFAGDMTFSPSGKWLSFVAIPTASMSMDGNMLCVVTSDGKHFKVIDEIIFGVGKPKWAPSTDTLAFIAGGGRIVFGFTNKDLKVKEMPVSFTPENFADLDFDWITNKTIVTSRVQEKPWSNDFSKHPLPSLYAINIETNQQVKITEPPKGYGDYEPVYVKSIDKLTWRRGISINDRGRTLWIANPDGSEARKWLNNVDEIVFYEGN